MSISEFHILAKDSGRSRSCPVSSRRRAALDPSCPFKSEAAKRQGDLYGLWASAHPEDVARVAGCAATLGWSANCTRQGQRRRGRPARRREVASWRVPRSQAIGAYLGAFAIGPGLGAIDRSSFRESGPLIRLGDSSHASAAGSVRNPWQRHLRKFRRRPRPVLQRTSRPWG